MNTLAFPFSIKSVSEAGIIEGVISAFGKVDSYLDTVAPGAYTKALAGLTASGRKLPLLYQHDAHRPIGVWTKLAEAPEGLVGTAKLTMEAPDAKTAHALARDGALTGISIGFKVPAGGSRMDGDTRVLTEIDLKEASLVTFPADPHARVHSVKAIGTVRDIEDLFREHGMSGRRAKAAAAAAWKSLNSEDDDAAAEAELAAMFKASASRLGIQA